MEVLFLSKDDKGFTKWATTDNEEGMKSLLEYFCNNIYCEDFIVYFKDYPGTEHPLAVSLEWLAKSYDMKIKFRREKE